MKTIDEIAFFLQEKGITLKPLEPFFIKKLEEYFEISFPTVYKRFLELMGNGAGEYMMGSSVFYEDIFSLRKWTNELVTENQIQDIPISSFVFWMHQGYQSAYFLSNSGEDPPVYYYSEGKDLSHFIKTEDTLTDFFIAQLKLSGFSL